MAAHPAALSTVTDLTPAELSALVGAASWYAKRHEDMISNLADDPSAAAEEQRERYLALHAALWKLGVRLRLPDGINTTSA